MTLAGKRKWAYILKCKIMELDISATQASLLSTEVTRPLYLQEAMETDQRSQAKDDNGTL